MSALRTGSALAAILLVSVVVRADESVEEVRELARAPALPALPAPGAVDVPDDARDLLARPLTADTALQVALANNRGLRASLRALGVFQGRVITAGTLPNPEVEFDLRNPVEEADPLQADVLIGFDLTHALLTGLRITVAEAALDAERLRVAGEVLELGYRVRAAFYAAQGAEQNLVLATRNLDAVAAARDAAAALFKAGNVRELDLATQEAAYEEARLIVASHELDRVERLESLRRLLGVHGARATLRIDPTLQAATPASVPPDLERRAVEANLDLRELRARLAMEGHRTQLERTKGWMQGLAVDAHAEQDGDRWEIGGGLVLSLPIFDRRQGPIAEAEAAFDTLRDREEALGIELRSAARETRARVESTGARVTHYAERVLPARRRVLEQTMLQYNAMQIGVFALLAAHRATLDAELGHVDALRDHWTALAALDALLAGRRVEAARASAPMPSRTSDTGTH